MSSTTHGLACPRGGARRSTTIAALLIGSALGLAPAPAIPQPQEIADQVFSESLAVLEVEVPVQVLRDGVPVRGLDQTDFAVLDRGVERAIVDFEVIDLGIAGPGAPASAQEDRPDAQRSLLVLVDYSFNAAQLVAQTIDATRQMVAAQLHPRDRVAIVALGARGRIAILTGFTADRDRIEMALELARALADRKRREARDLARALDEQGPRTAEQRATPTALQPRKPLATASTSWSPRTISRWPRSRPASTPASPTRSALSSAAPRAARGSKRRSRSALACPASRATRRAPGSPRRSRPRAVA